MIGSYSHARAGEGALIGGAIGAASGALVGNEMDRQEREDYHRYANAREEDYPPEYREYGYHTYAPAYQYYSPPPAPPVTFEYEYRQTRYCR